MIQSWRCVIAGVDASPEAARAGRLAAALAEAAGVECRLLHAVRDQAADIASLQLPMDLAPMAAVLLRLAREEVTAGLRGAVSSPVLASLRVELGAPALVIRRAVADLGAGSVVVGGKHHFALGKWLGGRTAHHLVNTLDVPVIVAAHRTERPARLLVAVDLSSSSRVTLAVAQRYAQLLDAEMLVLHAVEPVPATLKAALLVDAALGEDVVFRRSAEAFEQGVWRWVEYPRADRLLRRGSANDVIQDQARAWRADLVVVGSHGKRAFDRLLVGSTTHRLVDDLPTSVMVVPAWRAAASQPQEQETAAARAG